MTSEETKLVDASGGRLADVLRPHARRLGVVVGLLALLVATNLALPYSVKLLIDDVFPHEDGTGGNWGLLWLILPLLGLIFVIRNALFYPSRMLAVRVSEDVCFSMRQRLFEYLQQLNLRFYKAQQPGKVGSRLLDDTFKIQFFIQDKLPTLLLNLLLAQVLLIILYAVNWRLALASSLVLPLHFGTYWFFKRPIKRRHSEAQENVAAAYGNVIEKFLGMEVVKGFTGEARERARFHSAIDASRHSQIGTQRYEFMQKVVADLFVGAGTVFLFGFGAWQVMQGHMTGGTFIMFFGYVGMLYPAMQEVISGTSHLSKTTACLDRVFEMLQQPGTESDPAAPADGAPDVPILGAVEFRNVSFAHGHGRTVLKNISLSIRPGERVAITGPSGSGKSTLLNLLPRFIDPTAGEVLIDGHDVRSIPISRLRNAIGIAFQEVFLFDASISENLRYARPDATIEELADVCRLTGADRFIEKRTEGYDSRIGPYGSDLSRGERQRINIARALLKNPLVLVLDEAAASIDNKSSVAVMRAIFKRLRNRTIIMITHKQELLQLADRVVVIREGRVEFDGPPTEYTLLDLKETPLTGYKAPESGVRSALRLVNPVRETESAPGVASVTELRPPAPDPATPEAKQPTAGRTRTIATALMVLAGTALLGPPACVSESRATRSFGVESARASGGLLVSDAGDEQAALFRAAIEQSENRDSPIASRLLRVEGGFAPDRDQIEFAGEVFGASDRQQAVQVALGERGDPQEPEPTLDASPLPPDSGRLIALPKLGATELAEMIHNLALSAETEQGYQRVDAQTVAGLPQFPEEIHELAILSRRDGSGAEALLCLGYRTFLSQPPQLWVVSLSRAAAEAPWAAGTDLASVQTRVEALVAGLTAMRSNLTHEDLGRAVVQLSYIDGPGAISALQGLGVSVIADAAQVPQTIEYARLPLVILMPTPTEEQTGLVGDAGPAVRGNFGNTMLPNTATPLAPNPVTSPSSRLLVLYHPANPGQLARVRNLLGDYIDRPARQIFVEGMVLEISEDGLKDLGIEWQFREGPIDLILGKLTAGGAIDSLTFSNVDSRDVPLDWSVRIRALVRDGKAEILSRPGVLTIDNRQATIRVGEDIPIATSQEGTSVGSNKLSFNFQYIPTGILLNVRPRIAEHADEISMLIDTIVSAVVPGRDLEIRSSDGELLATAPTISTRRVQTYARIDNNTPFIIGGLVSRDLTVTRDKIPLLGDLPLVGIFFRAERTERTKREVIIVLTPYVLPEESYTAGVIPKDDDLFDSFGNQLFRESYRIRAEDVFDLRFLPENRRIVAYSELAARVVRRDARLAETLPFRDFTRGRIPGEDILVHRMIYEVIKRLDVKGQQYDLPTLIAADRIIFLESEQFGGYSVQFMERVMSRLGGGADYASFFKNKRDKALVFTFHYDRESDDPLHLATEPIPEVAVYDCPDRKAWGRLLWELNQPTPDGRKRFSIVLNDESDLTRLRRAIMLKKVIAANGGADQVSLANFSVGKVLMMPETKEGQTHILDADVARLFFHTEHYYSAAIKVIEKRLAELDAALRTPEIKPLLDGAELP